MNKILDLVLDRDRDGGAWCIMPSPLPPVAENKPLAIAFIVVAALIFALADTFAKQLVATIPPLEALWIRSIFALAVTLTFAVKRVGRQAFVTHHPVQQGLRGIAILASSLLYLVSLSHLPLADTTAINFVWPLLVTVLSVLLLGEKIGIRRSLATLVGFAGMLLIIRPGSSAFQFAAIYPIAAAILWALASVMTRGMVATEVPEATLLWSSAIIFIGSSLVVPFVWVTPNLHEIYLAGMVGLGSAIGHMFVVFAYGRANASTLAPFAYFQLVWAMPLGWLVFGTFPDRWILAGSALIVASGIYTAHRERVRRAEQIRTN